MEIASTKPRGNPTWQKGVSGNPAGRPVASRQRLGEKIIANIAALWEDEGEAVLRRLIADDPATFAKLAFQILPKEALVSVTQSPPAGLAPDDWQTLRTVLDLIQAHAPEGAAPGEIFGFIEHALRAEFAKPVIPAPPY
jgi:hypothetical protein